MCNYVQLSNGMVSMVKWRANQPILNQLLFNFSIKKIWFQLLAIIAGLLSSDPLVTQSSPDVNEVPDVDPTPLGV